MLKTDGSFCIVYIYIVFVTGNAVKRVFPAGSVIIDIFLVRLKWNSGDQQETDNLYNLSGFRWHFVSDISWTVIPFVVSEAKVRKTVIHGQVIHLGRLTDSIFK